MNFEIRQLDAWMDCEGWTINDSWNLGVMTMTSTADVRRAFRRFLSNHGITFYRGRTITIDYGDYLEICDRKTKEPLFSAMLLF